MRLSFSSPRGVAALATALVVVAGTTPAAAQSSAAAAAEALFAEAMTAYEKQDYATACPKLRESQRLDPAPGTQWNLAECEERRGLLATAWSAFTALGNDPSAPRATDAKARAAALAPRVPKLTVRLAAGAPEATSVELDGVALGAASLGTALPVDPGKHSVTASLAGARASAFTIELAERDAKTLEVAPAPAAEATPAPVAPVPPRVSQPSPPPTNGRRTAGFVIGGVGVVGLGLGAVTGIVALGKKSAVEDPANGCTPTTCATDAGVDAAKAGRTMAIVSTIGFGVGLAAAGVGAYLILSSPSATTTTTTTTSARPRRAPGTIRVGVAPTLAGAGLVLSGSLL